MAWRKSPPELVALFEASIPKDGDVEFRKMFGYPAAFVNGTFFAGLFQDDFALRLSEDHRKEYAETFGAFPFEPMAGRPMREYVRLAPDLLKDAPKRKRWVAKSLAFARTLPAKKAKASRPKARRAAGKARGA
jgi:TfoX/Sxy family transcriptional regulator of competence genes